MDQQSGAGGSTHSSVKQTKILFNGTEYGNIDAMPHDVRQLYEKVLCVAETATGLSRDEVTGIGDEILRNAHVSGASGAADIKKTTKFESSSPWPLIGSIVLFAFIALLFFFFHYR